MAAIAPVAAAAIRPRSEIERNRKSTTYPPVNHAEFSGTVTIDNQPPAIRIGHVLLSTLYDPKNPPPDKKPPALCDCAKRRTFQIRAGWSAPRIVRCRLLPFFGEADREVFADPMRFKTSTMTPARIEHEH